MRVRHKPRVPNIIEPNQPIAQLMNDEKNSRLVENYKYKPAGLKEAIVKLHENNILNDNTRLLISSTSMCVAAAKKLVTLFTTTNENVIPEIENIIINDDIKLNLIAENKKVAAATISTLYGLCALHNAGLLLNEDGTLQSDNISAVCTEKSKAYARAKALVSLYNSGLLTGENRNIISKHSAPENAASALIDLEAHKDGFNRNELDKIFSTIKSKKSPANTIKALIILRAAGLMPQDADVAIRIKMNPTLAYAITRSENDLTQDKLDLFEHYAKSSTKLEKIDSLIRSLISLTMLSHGRAPQYYEHIKTYAHHTSRHIEDAISLISSLETAQLADVAHLDATKNCSLQALEKSDLIRTLAGRQALSSAIFFDIMNHPDNYNNDFSYCIKRFTDSYLLTADNFATLQQYRHLIEHVNNILYCIPNPFQQGHIDQIFNLCRLQTQGLAQQQDWVQLRDQLVDAMKNPPNAAVNVQNINNREPEAQPESSVYRNNSRLTLFSSSSSSSASSSPSSTLKRRQDELASTSEDDEPAHKSPHLTEPEDAIQELISMLCSHSIISLSTAPSLKRDRYSLLDNPRDKKLLDSFIAELQQVAAARNIAWPDHEILLDLANAIHPKTMKRGPAGG